VERRPVRSSMTSSSSPARLDRCRRKQKVIKDQNAHPGQLGQRAGITSVGPAEGQVVEQPRRAHV
jgi:hypothetical protein